MRDAATIGWHWLHWLWHLYPLCHLGNALISIHTTSVCLRWAHLRERVRWRKWQTQNEPFCESRSQEEKWWGLYGWIPLNQPLSWLSWHWGDKCHANSAISPEMEPLPSPSVSFLPVKDSVLSVPQLITTLPLTQQLNIFLLASCLLPVWQWGRHSGYSKPNKRGRVFVSCWFIWCFWNADLTPFLRSCPPTDCKGINRKECEWLNSNIYLIRQFRYVNSNIYIYCKLLKKIYEYCHYLFLPLSSFMGKKSCIFMF